MNVTNNLIEKNFSEANLIETNLMTDNISEVLIETNDLMEFYNLEENFIKTNLTSDNISEIITDTNYIIEQCNSEINCFETNLVDTSLLPLPLTNEQQNVTVCDVQPLPKAVRSQRKRRGLVATVITSSPVKNQLIEKEKIKEDKIKRKAAREAKVPKEKKKKTKVRETNTENIFCPGCNEKYMDPPTEDWISCTSCKVWWHESCSNYEKGNFNCDFC